MAHSPKQGCTQGGEATRRECDTSLKNRKSAIKLLQVVLASAPTAKTRVFASKHAQRPATPAAAPPVPVCLLGAPPTGGTHLESNVERGGKSSPTKGMMKCFPITSTNYTVQKEIISVAALFAVFAWVL
jgi:hypothetical protein